MILEDMKINPHGIQSFRTQVISYQSHCVPFLAILYPVTTILYQDTLLYVTIQLIWAGI